MAAYMQQQMDMQAAQGQLSEQGLPMNQPMQDMPMMPPGNEEQMQQMMEAMQNLDIEKLMQSIPPEMAEMMSAMQQGGIPRQ